MRNIPYRACIPLMSSLVSSIFSKKPLYHGYMTDSRTLECSKPKLCPNSWSATQSKLMPSVLPVVKNSSSSKWASPDKPERKSSDYITQWKLLRKFQHVCSKFIISLKLALSSLNDCSECKWILNKYCLYLSCYMLFAFKTRNVSHLFRKKHTECKLTSVVVRVISMCKCSSLTIKWVWITVISSDKWN